MNGGVRLEGRWSGRCDRGFYRLSKLRLLGNAPDNRDCGEMIECMVREMIHSERR